MPNNNPQGPVNGQAGPGLTRLERALMGVIVVLVLVMVFWSLQKGQVKDGYTAENFSPPDFSAAAEKVMPSLVKVENEGIAGHPDITGGGGGQVEVAQTREGTGFFIDKDGRILTNYHVVEGAQALRVITRERKSYPAELIGADVLTDVALIKIKPDFNVTPAVMGDSSRLKIGQWALAMGNPLGLEFFSAAGIISGFGPPGPNYIGFYDFIQVDLNIEPGNSGGPLVNYKGEVVGVNEAYLGPGTGIGFAIPINRVKEVSDALLKDGKISRGFLGIIGQPITAGLMERLGMKDLQGALVSEVLAGSPAEAAGLKPMDVVLAWGGAPVTTDRVFQEKIYSSPGGKKVDMLVLRGGRQMRLAVTLGELEAHTLITQRIIRQCGITLQPVPDQLAKRMGMKDISGLMVLKVIPGCPAFEGGLRFGDVVKKVEGQTINNVSDFYRVYAGARPGAQVLVQIVRSGRPMFLTIRQGEGP